MKKFVQDQIDKNTAKLRQRQRETIEKEAQKLGSRLLECIEYADEGSVMKLVGTSLRAVVGGKYRPDSFQIFIFETNGLRHVYVQPYSNLATLPGEHYAILKGCFSAPAEVKKSLLSGAPLIRFFASKHVWASNDKETAAVLKKNTAIRAATRKLKRNWTIGNSIVKFKWLAQICALGNGRSLLVLKAGRYGGLTSYIVGLTQFTELVQAVAGVLPPSQVPAQNFPSDVHYEDMVSEYLSVGSVPVYSPA